MGLIKDMVDHLNRDTKESIMKIINIEKTGEMEISKSYVYQKLKTKNTPKKRY